MDVLFYDRRADPGEHETDVYLASSDDEAGTFTNRRVSSVAFDSSVGPTFGPAYGTDFGTRLGLTSNDNGAYAAWTDTRLGNPDTGRQDVFGATVSLGSGGRLSVLLPVLAVLVRGRRRGHVVAPAPCPRHTRGTWRAGPAGRQRDRKTFCHV